MKEGQSFEEVASQYDPLIKSVIRKLHFYKNSEEMYQIGLIALWEAYEKFNPEKGSFGGYAKAVVKGRMLTALRKSRVYDERHVFAKPTEAGGHDFMEIADPTRVMPLEKETIALYLQGLSVRQLYWVEQALLQGKKTREIAEGERVSQNTVRTWKKEALKKMRVNARKIG